MYSANILTLVRDDFQKDKTLGKLFIPTRYGSILFDEVVEDCARPFKIKHETCIEEGFYKLEVTYSPKFKREMIIVVDVPNFSGIRLHYGKDQNWTSGCILHSSREKEAELIEKVKKWRDPTFLSIINQPKMLY